MTDVKYDQHFLNSKRVLNLIAKSSNVTKNDVVLEIGPGKGFLTKKLLSLNPKKLISLEIDENFKDELENIAKSFENFEVVFGNAVELIDLINFDKLVANIPYSITEPLYKKILLKGVKCSTLLHGKNFYDNSIVNKNSKWFYIINAFCIVKKIEDVDGKYFEPKAKVKSCIINISHNYRTTEFEKFVKILFLKEDKNLKNAVIFSIADYFDIGKKEAKEKYSILDIDEKYAKIKLEMVSNKVYVSLLEEIRNKLFQI